MSIGRGCFRTGFDRVRSTFWGGCAFRHRAVALQLNHSSEHQGLRRFHSIRSALFPGIYFMVLSQSLAASPVKESSKSSAPVLIGEEIVINLVNSLFLFDRLVAKSSPVTSPNFMERVSRSSSPFYPDYLQYRRGRIDRAEVARRLPHVAMMGDSIAMNYYNSSSASLFWRARVERRKNWFLDTDPSPESIYSIYERLEKLTPLVAAAYNGVGSEVKSPQVRDDFRRRLVRTHDLARQTREVLRNKRFPDLLMICTGHINTDWTRGLSPVEREHPAKRLRELATLFRENYAQSVQLLIDRAKTENHKVAIVVFGLCNFESFFEAREAAEAMKAKNPKLYPYLEIDYQTFMSMAPAYRGNMIRLGRMMNEELQLMVAELNRGLERSPNVQLRYSDALANARMNRVELLHPMDAWHPSKEGHRVLAQAAFRTLIPSLQFLGIKSKATP